MTFRMLQHAYSEVVVTKNERVFIISVTPDPVILRQIVTQSMNAPLASQVTEDGCLCCHARALSVLTHEVEVSPELCDENLQASTECCGYHKRTGDHFYHRACLVATCARLLFC